MERLGWRSRLWRTSAVAVAALAVAWAPAPASAEDSFAQVSAWEVQEFLKLLRLPFRGGHAEAKRIVSRLADASLVGTATGPICEVAGTASPCVIGVRAESHVSFRTFRGPFSGELTVLIENPTNPLPDSVLGVATMHLKGTLDFCPDPLQVVPAPPGGPLKFMCQQSLPFGLVEGTWRSRDLDARGTLTGLFQFPVPAAMVLPPEYAGLCDIATRQMTFGGPVEETLTGHVYAGQAQGDVRCLSVHEFSLGLPLVLFSADLKQTSDYRGRDH
jgi:hypothetical protein